MELNALPSALINSLTIFFFLIDMLIDMICWLSDRCFVLLPTHHISFWKYRYSYYYSNKV